MMKPAEQARIVSMGRAITEGHYPVCARFLRYLDFRSGDDNVIGLTDMADEGGAHTIVLAGLKAGWAARAAEFIVEPNAVIFDDQVFARDAQCLFRDSVDSADTAAFAALPAAEQRRRLGVFRDTLLEHAAPLSMAVALDISRREFFQGGFARALCDRFLEGAAACDVGEYAHAAALLQGVGYGLTPSGDDFLCGVMLALHSADHARELAVPLAANLLRSAFMSRTFLRDAIAGRWPRRLRDVMESLGGRAGRLALAEALGRAGRRATPRRDAISGCAGRSASSSAPAEALGRNDTIIRQAVLRALDHGASSGADLLSGFLHTTLRHVAESRDQACA
jgi:hypothetical protein